MITVLMATYNGEKFIEQQLDSIRSQTLPADRVVILDDCSTDKTFDIVDTFIQKYNLVTWEIYQNESNQGHYRTFINLTKMVDKGYTFFSDQDDIWDDCKIELMMKEFYNSQISMVFCKSRYINETGEVIKELDTTSKSRIYPVKKILQSWPSGYQTVFRSEVLKTIIEKKYFEYPCFQFHDVLFGMLSCLFGEVVELDTTLDSHRLHLSNVTLSSKSSSFHNSLEERLNYYTKMYKRYEVVTNLSVEFWKYEVKKVSESYGELYKARAEFIEKRTFKSIREMYKLKQFYNGFRAFFSDIIYSLRLQRLFAKIMRR